MSEIYTNLPQKEKESLDKTIQSLQTEQYVENFQFKQNDIDAAIGFFVKRGFDRVASEDISYIILKQSVIDGVPSQSILDSLSKSSDVELSQLLALVINSNRYKTSKLGLRNQQISNSLVTRNIID
jgi:hypothetical protein